jgi:hypothetical protein
MAIRWPKAFVRGVFSALFFLAFVYVSCWQLAVIFLGVANDAVDTTGGSFTGLAAFWWERLPSVLDPSEPSTRGAVEIAIVLTIVTALFVVFARRWWRERENRRRYGPFVDGGLGGGKPRVRRQ